METITDKTKFKASKNLYWFHGQESRERIERSSGEIDYPAWKYPPDAGCRTEEHSVEVLHSGHRFEDRVQHPLGTQMPCRCKASSVSRWTQSEKDERKKNQFMGLFSELPVTSMSKWNLFWVTHHLFYESKSKPKEWWHVDGPSRLVQGSFITSTLKWNLLWVNLRSCPTPMVLKRAGILWQKLIGRMMSTNLTKLLSQSKDMKWQVLSFPCPGQNVLFTT